jgi:Holliday junction DNA helicase RuvA
MFGFLEGALVGLSPTQTYINIGGVGYEVQLTLRTYEAIKDLDKALLYIHLQIREDAWTLYGFATEPERETFRKLLSVSGVGAATARIMLSSLSPNDLSRMVANGDSKALEKVKGIGAKTAQRIILELKDKLTLVDTQNLEINNNLHNTNENDTLNALLGLGIAKAVAENAMKKAQALSNPTDLSVAEWIKLALKNL